ncbi:MAG: glycosyltransferase family 39 protein [Promethearchaeota archaeon]
METGEEPMERRSFLLLGCIFFAIIWQFAISILFIISRTTIYLAIFGLIIGMIFALWFFSLQKEKVQLFAIIIIVALITTISAYATGANMHPEFEWDYYTKIKEIAIGNYPAKDVHYGTEYWTKPTSLTQVIIGSICRLLNLQHPLQIYFLASAFGPIGAILTTLAFYRISKEIFDEKTGSYSALLFALYSCVFYPAVHFNGSNFLTLFAISFFITYIKNGENKYLFSTIPLVCIGLLIHVQMPTFFLIGAISYIFLSSILRRSIKIIEMIFCIGLSVAFVIGLKSWYPIGEFTKNGFGAIYDSLFLNEGIFALEYYSGFFFYKTMSIIFYLVIIGLGWIVIWNKGKFEKQEIRLIMYASIGVIVAIFIGILLQDYIQAVRGFIIYKYRFVKLLLDFNLATAGIYGIKEIANISIGRSHIRLPKNAIPALVLSVIAIAPISVFGGLLVYKPFTGEIVEIDTFYISTHDLETIRETIPNQRIVLTDITTANILPYWCDVYPIAVDRGHLLNWEDTRQIERENDVKKALELDTEENEILAIMNKYNAQFVIINKGNLELLHENQILLEKFKNFEHFTLIIETEGIAIFVLN